MSRRPSALMLRMLPLAFVGVVALIAAAAYCFLVVGFADQVAWVLLLLGATWGIAWTIVLRCVNGRIPINRRTDDLEPGNVERRARHPRDHLPGDQ